MLLKEISLLNYKNIEEAHLAFSSKINCFVGLNGQGKTNLLDAIHFLAFCKSMTTMVDSHVVRHNGEYMMLQGLFGTDDGAEEKIYCGLKRNHRKVFKRNDKEYARLSEHIGRIKLVLVSPDDIALVTEGSEERRKFMDQIISQYDPEYLYQLIRYRSALQQRNVLLRQEMEPDESYIDVYEMEMAQSGTMVCSKRYEFIKEFTPIFKDICTELAGDGEAIGLRYQSHGLEGSLLEQIQKSRSRDRIMGHSLCGVHRDDMEMSLNGFPIKREGSQGQNKTFVIGLKFAQYEFLKRKSGGQLPILMLDDIFDKLDINRVERIVKKVSSSDYGQIFITDTKREFLDMILQRIGENFSFFKVDKGVITYET